MTAKGCAGNRTPLFLWVFVRHTTAEQAHIVQAVTRILDPVLGIMDIIHCCGECRGQDIIKIHKDR